MPNITVAVAENGLQSLIDNVTDNFHVSTSGSSGGNFRVDYAAGIRLAGGTVDMKNNPDELVIRELDIIYDPLSVTLKIDIPEVCIGGFCIFWVPIKGCVLRAPELCVFSPNPDITIPINLSGLIQSEISIATDLEIDYFDNPAGTGLDIFEAHAQDKADAWQVNLRPKWFDLDIIDVADTVGNILDSAIDNFVDGLFGWLPDWAADIISGMLGGIVDLIRGILDIADDVGEWISDLVFTELGLADFILDKLTEHFGNFNTIYSIENPYPVVAGPPFPVLLPVSNLNFDITDDELILSADI